MPLDRCSPPSSRKRLRPRNLGLGRRERRRLPGLCLLLGVLFAPGLDALVAQEGPPPHVIRAVDATVEMLRSSGEEALRAYVEAADPAWRSQLGESNLLGLARRIRSSVGGRIDELDVEAAPGGVVLRLRGGGAERQVEVGISPNGVTNLRLLAAERAGVGDPPANRDAAVRDHVRALEGAHRKEEEALLSEFEQERLSEQFLAETTREERRRLLAEIRAAAAAAGAALLDEDDGEVSLTLRGRGEKRVIFRTTEEAPFLIDSLRVGAGEPAPELDWDSMAATFERLESEGFSGVVHLARRGRTVLERAYGEANRELGIPMALDTIFGIGSTPISFTVAGIRLLAQRGRLDLDDPIGRYFDDVPPDKAAMTVRHLITGRSGLPDFHDRPGDWDADLAWIDRETAVRRIFEQKLLFEPGAGRAHSHSAYGLAAAILEIVSGSSYQEFLRSAIFDPAGMTRTGMYGDHRGFSLEDFAVGYGPSSVGLPNIPPNWGPTSWLVLGSGGMFSTLGDMLRFHRFTRSGELFEGEHAKAYGGELVGVGGSDRGFYIFEAMDDDGDVAILMINGEGRTDEMRSLSRSLEQLVMND